MWKVPVQIICNRPKLIGAYIYLVAHVTVNIIEFLDYRILIYVPTMLCRKQSTNTRRKLLISTYSPNMYNFKELR